MKWSMADKVEDYVMLLEEVVFSRKKRSLPFSQSSVMLFAISMNRFMWLVCREICLAFFYANGQKSLGNTDLRTSSHISIFSSLFLLHTYTGSMMS